MLHSKYHFDDKLSSALHASDSQGVPLKMFRLSSSDPTTKTDLYLCWPFFRYSKWMLLLSQNFNIVLYGLVSLKQIKSKFIVFKKYRYKFLINLSLFHSNIFLFEGFKAQSTREFSFQNAFRRWCCHCKWLLSVNYSEADFKWNNFRSHRKWWNIFNYRGTGSFF